MKRSAKVFSSPVVRRRTASIIYLVSLVVAVVSPHVVPVSAFAVEQQQTARAKRPLTHQDYDTWRSIQAPQISRDGKYIAYAFLPQDGDGDIIVRNVSSGTEWRAPRGYRPPVPPPDDPGANVAEFQAAQARLVRPVFTADSRFLVFSIEPLKAEVNKAKKEKKKPEDMPKAAMGIMDLSTGTVTRIEKVKNFQVPEDTGGFVAYLLEPKPEEKGSGASSTPAQNTSATAAPAASPSESPRSPQSGSETGPRDPAARPQKKKEYGSELVLRNTATGTERKFVDALDYSITKDAKTLVFTVSSKKEEGNGVYAVNTQGDGVPIGLLSGKGKYQKLSWDEDHKQLAFISDKDDAEAKQPKIKLYYWARPTSDALGTASEAVAITSPGFRKDFVVSEKANLNFSLDGSRLFLGTATPPEPEKNPDEDIPADERVLERVNAVLWLNLVGPATRGRAAAQSRRSHVGDPHLQ